MVRSLPINKDIPPACSCSGPPDMYGDFDTVPHLAARRLMTCRIVVRGLYTYRSRRSRCRGECSSYTTCPYGVCFVSHHLTSPHHHEIRADQATRLVMIWSTPTLRNAHDVWILSARISYAIRALADLEISLPSTRSAIDTKYCELKTYFGGLSSFVGSFQTAFEPAADEEDILGAIWCRFELDAGLRKVSACSKRYIGEKGSWNQLLSTSMIHCLIGKLRDCM